MIDNKDLEFSEKLTQEFVDKSLDVLVFVNTKTNKRLYLKPTHRMGKFIGLEPLTKSELEDAKIEESLTETVNAELFDITIEESIDETSPIQPISHNFDAQNKESMRRAKEFAENQLAKLEGKSSPDVKALEAENEDLRSKLDLIATNAFERKKRELSAPPEITTVEQLQGFEMAKKSRQEPQIPSGTVPWSAIEKQNTNPQAFGSHSEMIDNIRDRCSAQNPSKEDRKQAQAVLDKLMQKAFSGQKEANKAFSYETPKDLSISDLLAEKYRRRKNLAKGV